MKIDTWEVKCRDAGGTEYDIRLVAPDESAAMRGAEYSLANGRSVAAKAVSAKISRFKM